MKRVLFLAILAAAIVIPAASAYTYSYYAGDGYGYQRPQAWTHNTYSFLPNHHVNRYSRPSGYGLTSDNWQAYPPRNWGRTQYCDNTETLGHTSKWAPGRYFSGLDGRQLAHPRNRPAFQKCGYTQSTNRNYFNPPYW